MEAKVSEQYVEALRVEFIVRCFMMAKQQQTNWPMLNSYAQESSSNVAENLHSHEDWLQRKWCMMCFFRSADRAVNSAFDWICNCHFVDGMKKGTLIPFVLSNKKKTGENRY